MNSFQAPPPRRDDAGILLAPRVAERLEHGLRGGQGRGGVDRLHRRGEGFALVVRDVLHRRADQVHDAGLDVDVGPHRGRGVMRADQAVAAQDGSVLQSPVAQFGEHPQPKLATFGGGHPDAQDVLEPLDVETDDQVRDLVGRRAVATNLDSDPVDEHDRKDLIDRPGRPGTDLLDHDLGDFRDGFVGHVDPVDLC